MNSKSESILFSLCFISSQAKTHKHAHLPTTIFFTFLIATNTNNSVAQWFSDFSVPQNHLDVLLKHRLPSPESLIQSPLEWCLIVGTSNRFPGDAAAAGLGTTLWENPRTRISPKRSPKGSPLKSAQLLRLLFGGKGNSCHDSWPFSSFSRHKIKNRKRLD